ncbi:MAG TPA: tRNA pseudouridine(38-40) synthase TruA [Methylomirabilota bacterium]
MLAYDGTGSHGWQTQPDVPTVQGALAAAAGRLFAGDVRLVGASRTDAGVHALGQTVALTADSSLPAATVQAALNAHLAREVRVVAAFDAPPGFDARRAALGKRYAYLIDTGPVPSPLLLRYAWHVRGPLDLAAMRAGLAALRGRHDFSAFCAAPGREVEPTCRVRALHLRRRKSVVAIVVSADRFLHHMVRNIAGSAVEIGRGARPPAWLGDVLASRDRTRAGPTAPAHGLTLLRVTYALE